MVETGEREAVQAWIIRLLFCVSYVFFFLLICFQVCSVIFAGRVVCHDGPLASLLWAEGAALTRIPSTTVRFGMVTSGDVL